MMTPVLPWLKLRSEPDAAAIPGLLLPGMTF